MVWNAPTPTLPEGSPLLELSYDDFVDLVEQRRVSRALIPFSRGNAQVVLTDGQRASVELINDKKLKYSGRLDKDSEGLMLLSADGDWLNKNSHPSKEIKKKYRHEQQ